MKLKSKFTLLLLVGAVLLAAPAMALITDMGPNILPAPTSQSDKANVDAPGGKPSGNPDGNKSPAIQGGRSDIAEPSASTLPVQKIWSNKAHYAPGARVILTGSYWQPGESVRIDVDDDHGKTWSRNLDVRADASGRIQYQFQLPEWFVAPYEVTAMGAQSGVATTSFTQSNVSFASASPDPAGRSADYRTHGGKNTTHNTSCATEGTDACLSGDPGGANGNITELSAHFESAKQAPVAQPQPIVSTDEDAAKTITLSAADEDGDDLSFFIVTAPNHGTLGPIGELTCAGTVPRICSANVTYMPDEMPDEDYNGFDIFSFKASDGTEDSNPAPVSILVNPVNDTPVATDETRTISEDGGPLSIDFGALLSDVETSDANLTYDITDPPDPTKGSLDGAGSTRNFTPAANFNGTVDIGYTLADRGDPDKCSADNPPCAAASTSAQKTVSVTVDAVNDAPSFTRGPDQTRDEDSGAQTVEGWATEISAGPNESGQTLDFQLTNDNNNLFATGGQPSVAPNGTLTYTPAADKNGSATVNIRATDTGTTANGGQDQSAEQTFTINVTAVNDAPIVSNLQGDSAANEGDVKTYTFDIADADSSIFSASVECGGASKGKLVAGSLQMTATNGEFECKFLDGLLSPTPVDISVQLSDGGKLSNVESRSVSVSNVAPTLTGLSSSSQNALAGTLNPVTFTPTATDASPRDLAGGFTWRWTIDGGTYGPVGGANQLYFSTCGTHTVEAQATDKDGGVSATSPQDTQSVSVYDGDFDPPLVDGSTNLVQEGQILPVKISIGCGTTNLTDLTPHIQLLSGNVSPESEIGSTIVASTPVSAADATQTMRPLDGGYIYNLQVPTNAAANTEYTILVNPFGATADDAATGMYLVIKIRE